MLVVTVTKQNEDFMVWRITNNGLISLQYPITITDSQYYLHHSPPTPLRYKPQGRSLSFAICCPLLSATTRFSDVLGLFIYFIIRINVNMKNMSATELCGQYWQQLCNTPAFHCSYKGINIKANIPCTGEY